MSFDFDGVDDAVDFASPGALDNAEPFSFAGWIAPDSAGEANGGRIIGKDSSGASVTWFLTMDTRPGPCLFFRRDYGTTDLDARTATNTIRTDGTFQHVALTWDGSATATNVHIYINGVEPAYQALTNGVGTKATDAANRMYLGNRQGLDRSFDGRMAYCHFYRRVLTVNEIRTLMYHPMGVGPIIGNTASTGGALHALPLGLVTGTGTTDYSGVSPEGSIIAGPVFHAQSPPINELFGPSAPMGGGAC